MSIPMYSDLRKLLGKPPVSVWPGDDQADAVLVVVTAMAKAYTRGNGFDPDGVPNDELRAVILSAACRMIANPRGIDLAESIGPQSVSFRGAFTGWTVAETFTLNRYRKRAE